MFYFGLFISPFSVAVNRVATFKELDSDLFRHGAFATLDDIDLRALVKCMAPEPETKEVSTRLGVMDYGHEDVI
jgi:hypothetical protein